MGIGLQPSRSVTPDIRRDLTDCALKGKLSGKEASNLVRAYATLTLARIGGTDELRTMKTILGPRKLDDGILRSAAIGLGVLGRTVEGDSRKEAAEILMKAIDQAKEDSVRNFAIISLAYLLHREDG